MTEELALPPQDDTEEVVLPEVPPKRSKVAKALHAPVAVAPEVAPAPTRVRIILEENDNIPPTGLFIGINGRSYVIRPGEEVAIPPEVIEVLNDAVEDIPRMDANNNVVDYRKKMRFPYRLLGK